MTKLRGFVCDCEGADPDCRRCDEGESLMALADDAKRTADVAQECRSDLARELRRAYRAGSGWTLDELAATTHLSRTQVHRIVAGLSVPSDD